MTTTPYEILGGAEGVRALVDRFYDLMDELPEAADIRAMHPEDLAESREKLYLFLSGWTGGPPLYMQKHGHPRLRARHLPFPIGIAERDAWMLCMTRALEEHEGLPRDEIRELTRAFQMGFALFLPFVVIDMVVAATLISMGMLVLPPILISLPFKILLFVLVDGWHLIVGSVIRSFY